MARIAGAQNIGSYTVSLEPLRVLWGGHDGIITLDPSPDLNGNIVSWPHRADHLTPAHPAHVPDLQH